MQSADQCCSEADAVSAWAAIDPTRRTLDSELGTELKNASCPPLLLGGADRVAGDCRGSIRYASCYNTSVSIQRRSTGINLTCVRFILYISYYANIILSVESGVGLNAFSATVKDGFRHHG